MMLIGRYKPILRRAQRSHAIMKRYGNDGETEGARMTSEIKGAIASNEHFEFDGRQSTQNIFRTLSSLARKSQPSRQAKKMRRASKLLSPSVPPIH